jgi:2-isopropylmalate synthase
MDLEALVTDELRETSAPTRCSGSTSRPRRAGRRTRRCRSARPRATELEGSFTGDGPVDAIFRAVNAATGIDARLRDFRVEAVTGGEDALGEVSVVVEYQGQSAGGQGVATDILEAAGMAYVRAISNGVRKARLAGGAPPVTARPAELATP